MVGSDPHRRLGIYLRFDPVILTGYFRLFGQSGRSLRLRGIHRHSTNIPETRVTNLKSVSVGICRYLSISVGICRYLLDYRYLKRVSPT